MNIIKCEECEINIHAVYCQQCEQHMCDECNNKIHNKGKRAEHLRMQILQGTKIFIQNSLKKY